MIVGLCVITVNLNVPFACMYMWVINETETKSLNKFQQSVNSHVSCVLNNITNKTILRLRTYPLQYLF